MNRDWRRIAETETANNFNNGYLIGELESNKEKHIFMQGISGGGSCSFCSSEINNRIVVLLDAPPATGDDSITIDGETYTAIWPGKNNFGRKRADWWVSAGTQHPHCILPDTLVSAGSIKTVMKAFYEGTVIELSTRKGYKITVTENHPVLTLDGFRFAKFLNEGDNIITCADSEGLFNSVNKNDNHVPVRIDDLFASNLHSVGMTSAKVPVSAEHFHGDGVRIKGDIDIININRFLRRAPDTFSFKHINEFKFSGRGRSFKLYSFCVRYFLIDCARRTSNSVVRVFRKALSLFNGRARHSCKHCGGTASSFDTLFDKTLSEGGTRHSKYSRKFLFRFSFLISFYNLFRKRGVRIDSNSGLVPDELVSVTRKFYSGHVYDLHDSINELYSGNGVIVKNCRCSWVRMLDMTDPFVSKLRAAMKS